MQKIHNLRNEVHSQGTRKISLSLHYRFKPKRAEELKRRKRRWGVGNCQRKHNERKKNADTSTEKKTVHFPQSTVRHETHSTFSLI